MACKDHGGPGALTSGKRRTPTPRATTPPRSRPAAQWPAWETAAYQAPTPARRRQQPAPLPPPRHVQENERVRQVAIFCADSLSDGWQAAVAGQISDYAQTTWQRLSRSRRKHNCKALARLARSILNAKNEIHKLAGQLSGQTASKFGLKGAARAFTEELVSNIPLNPIDAKMVAVARGVQVAGILLCLMDGRDLTECQCFIDLALAESKEQVNQMLIAAMSDWAGLARFTPKTSLT